jgi:hypothetical protein
MNRNDYATSVLTFSLVPLDGNAPMAWEDFARPRTIVDCPLSSNTDRLVIPEPLCDESIPLEERTEGLGSYLHVCDVTHLIPLAPALISASWYITQELPSTNSYKQHECRRRRQRPYVSGIRFFAVTATDGVEISKELKEELDVGKSKSDFRITPLKDPARRVLISQRRSRSSTDTSGSCVKRHSITSLSLMEKSRM